MAVPSQHRLLGFDARAMWLPENPHHPFDIKKPLSTDIFVWPSIFDLGEGVALSYWDPELAGFDRLPVPESVDWNWSLWDDLSRLKRYVADNWRMTGKPYWIIAITEHRGILSRLHRTRKLRWQLNRTRPAVVEASWKLLGYDVVADECLLSGLHNCGVWHTDDSRWLKYLNSHGLFDERRHANAFKCWFDTQASEHAPFWAAGLWLVGKGAEGTLA